MTIHNQSALIKFLILGKKSIFVKTEVIENRWFAVIKVADEEWHLFINYDEREKYNSLKM